MLIDNGRTLNVSNHIENEKTSLIDATGLLLLPGLNNNQIHFRGSGLSTKGDVAMESKAAVVDEMPARRN